MVRTFREDFGKIVYVDLNEGYCIAIDKLTGVLRESYRIVENKSIEVDPSTVFNYFFENEFEKFIEIYKGFSMHQRENEYKIARNIINIGIKRISEKSEREIKELELIKSGFFSKGMEGYFKLEGYAIKSVEVYSVDPITGEVIDEKNGSHTITGPLNSKYFEKNMEGYLLWKDHKIKAEEQAVYNIDIEKGKIKKICQINSNDPENNYKGNKEITYDVLKLFLNNDKKAFAKIYENLDQSDYGYKIAIKVIDDKKKEVLKKYKNQIIEIETIKNSKNWKSYEEPNKVAAYFKYYSK